MTSSRLSRVGNKRCQLHSFYVNPLFCFVFLFVFVFVFVCRPLWETLITQSGSFAAKTNFLSFFVVRITTTAKKKTNQPTNQPTNRHLEMILKRRDHKVYIQCGLLWPFSIVSCLHAFATAFRLLMTFHIQIDFLNCNLLSYSRKCWKNNKNWGFLDYEQKKQLIFMFQNVPIIIYNI